MEYNHYKTNRKKRKVFSLRCLLALALVAAVCSSAFLVAAVSRPVRLVFDKKLYFVCTPVVYLEETAQTSSISVSAGGGAGYVIERGKGYSAVYSLYMARGDAEVVCANLQKGGRKAEIYEVFVTEVYLPSADVAAKETIAAYFGLYYACISLLCSAVNEWEAGNLSAEGVAGCLTSCASVLTRVSTSVHEQKKLQKKRYSLMQKSIAQTIKMLNGYAAGRFFFGDIRYIASFMGDFYRQTAKNLKN